jgi:hypothetical protein
MTYRNLWGTLNVTQKAKEPVKELSWILITKISLWLLGDIPMNSRVQLMMASVDDIADEHALRESFAMKSRNPRSSNRGKLRGSKISYESKSRRGSWSESALPMAGFYSYGEIAPVNGGV